MKLELDHKALADDLSYCAEVSASMYLRREDERYGDGPRALVEGMLHVIGHFKQQISPFVHDDDKKWEEIVTLARWAVYFTQTSGVVPWERLVLLADGDLASYKQYLHNEDAAYDAEVKVETNP